MRRSIQDMVRADLVDREQLGIDRYGTSLYAYNGRDALLDAYEEALDLACYLRQAIEELKQIPRHQVLKSLPPEWQATRQHATDECGWYCTHRTTTATEPGQ